MQENICLHTIIEGHVQGVGFRYYVLQKADELGVVGWARNTYLGQVEVLAEGDQAKLEKLLAYLRTGPRSSFVSEIKPKWGKASGRFSNFSIKPTV
ncbi:MAG: acylphosphatase [Anaerolineaceae bacterium]|nr:acylphosphatase [Anaerolineaceae bacterium]